MSETIDLNEEGQIQLDPWERQPWDTPASFHAFHAFYLPQKPPRSVDRAYRAWYAQRRGLQIDDIRVSKKRAAGTWRSWSMGKRASDGALIEGAESWATRAEAWDRYLAYLDHALWEERRRQEREAEWNDAANLRERAERMEQFPLAKVERVEETYEDGRPKLVTIVYPAKWSHADAARHRDLAAKLARLAAEMETEKAALDLTSKGEKLDPNVIVVRDYLAAQEAQETAENVDGE